MLAKDAFDAACMKICGQYEQYGFKYIKSKKEIRAKINGYIFKICISTSRDNCSDCLVVFEPCAVVRDANGECLFYCNCSDIKSDFFFTEDTVMDLTPLYADLPSECRDKLIQSVETRRYILGRFCGWNVAFPEQQEQTAIDVCYWLDEKFFSNEVVINIIGKKIKAANY